MIQILIYANTEVLTLINHMMSELITLIKYHIN